MARAIVRLLDLKNAGASVATADISLFDSMLLLHDVSHDSYSRLKVYPASNSESFFRNLINQQSKSFIRHCRGKIQSFIFDLSLSLSFWKFK